MTTPEEKEIDNSAEILDMEELLEDDIEKAEEAENMLEWELKELWKINDEILNLKDALARAQADYQNLIRRVDRDRNEMWDYFTSSLTLKFLPIIDNLERIISSTPEELQNNSLFEWVKSLNLSTVKILDSVWVKSFVSIGEEVDPNYHDVMTQLPWEQGKIIQEFEKWYLIWEKVLRHAKVVVGNGE